MRKARASALLILVGNVCAGLSLRVTLLRHSQTEWNTEGRLQGASDSPLTERGVEQAIRAGQRLRAHKFDACYSSPLPRARLTADLVLAQLEAAPPLHTEEALRERAFGSWEGKRWETIQEEHADEVASYRDNADYAIPGGGESRSEVLSRALDFLDTLPSRHPDGSSVVCVTHSATITSILKHVLGLSQASGRAFEVKNLGITTLEYDEDNGVWMLSTLNDCAHLTDDPPLSLEAVKAAVYRHRSSMS